MPKNYRHANNYWALPDGFQEILPPFSQLLEHARQQILSSFNQYGYQLINPPMLEFLDTLNAGSGQHLDLSTFKVTDQISGRMLGLRADITPQIARIQEHYMTDSQLSRLCYCGNILLTGRNARQINREQLQFGAEFYGSDAIYTDYEMINLAMSCVLALNIDDLTIEIGDMGLLHELVAMMFDDKAQQSTFLEILSRRSVADLTQFLETNQANTPSAGFENKHWADFWQQYLQLLGKPDVVLPALKKLSADYQINIEQQLKQLSHLVDMLSLKYNNAESGTVQLQLDMCLQHNYGYHSGLIFYIYHPQLTEPALKGGRYQAAENIAATGFSADLYQLLTLMNPQDIATTQKIKALLPVTSAPKSVQENTQMQAFCQSVDALRQQGKQVVVILDKQSDDGQSNNGALQDNNNFSHELVLRNEQWQLVQLN